MNTAFIVLSIISAGQPADVKITVASKSFTESAILGEIVKQAGEHAGFDIVHKEQLGGTGVVFRNLKNGSIDIYPDYTGTIVKDILKDDSLTDLASIREALSQHGLRMSEPLGFDNSYEIGMRDSKAKQFGIRTISDLKRHPQLKFGFSSEFMDRRDGWPGLKQAYSLPHNDVTGMEHAIAYRALESGNIDGMVVYGTDANIKQYNIRVLEDDLDYFPTYDAVLLYREGLESRAPRMIQVIKQLAGRLSGDEMIELNSQVDIEKATPQRTAHGWLESDLGIVTQFEELTLYGRIRKATWEHLLMVIVSLSAAIAVAVPLGVLATKKPTLGQFVLAIAEIVQTIPGLALLVLLLGPLEFLGLQTVGPLPAIIALFLYSLLPIIRNTHAGISGIPSSVRDSATALGLPGWARLYRVELPLASPLILAGIKTTAVINVGYATLGGLIGAGGYGQTILTGLYRSDVSKMLEGAIPAAALALLVKMGFEWLERFIVPKGLRLKSTR